eukprot:163252_1
MSWLTWKVIGLFCFCWITLVFSTPDILSTMSQNTPTITKEWIFQFDLQNAKHWDDYQITTQKDKHSKLHGESTGCTAEIPVVFKTLCVHWNHKEGFSLSLKPSDVSKMNSHTLTRRLITKSDDHKDANKNCYWYSDVRACGRIHSGHRHLMTVSVGINDYGDYYDDYYDDYYYTHWQRYLYWQRYIANAYYDQYDGYNMYMDVDSDEKEQEDEKGGDIDEEANEFGISEGDIVEQAEERARSNVAKKLEQRLESKFEREMMSKLEGKIHKKVRHDHEEEYESQEKNNQGRGGDEDMDDEHSGIPSEELNDEQDRNEIPPHDSLSEDSV